MLAYKIVELVREQGIRERVRPAIQCETHAKLDPSVMLELLTAMRIIWRETNATRKEVQRWAKEELDLDD